MRTTNGAASSKGAAACACIASNEATCTRREFWWIVAPLLFHIFSSFFFNMSRYTYTAFMVKELLPNLRTSEVGYYTGMLIGSYFLGQVMNGITVGPLSSKIGPGATFSISAVGGIIFPLMHGFTKSFQTAFLICVMYGAVNGTMPLTKTRMSQLLDPTNSCYALAYLNVVCGITGICAPFVAGFMSYPALKHPFLDTYLLREYPFLLPNLTASVLNLCSLVMIIVMALRRKRRRRRKDGYRKRASLVSSSNFPSGPGNASVPVTLSNQASESAGAGDEGTGTSPTEDERTALRSDTWTHTQSVYHEDGDTQPPPNKHAGDVKIYVPSGCTSTPQQGLRRMSHDSLKQAATEVTPMKCVEQGSEYKCDARCQSFVDGDVSDCMVNASFSSTIMQHQMIPVTGFGDSFACSAANSSMAYNDNSPSLQASGNYLTHLRKNQTQMILSIILFGLLCMDAIMLDTLIPLVLMIPTMEGGFGLGTDGVASFMIAQSLCATLFTFVAPHLMQRLGLRRGFQICAALSIPFVLIFPMSTMLQNVAGFLLAIVSLIVGRQLCFQVCFVSSFVIINNCSPFRYIAHTNGLAVFSASILRLVGPAFAGAIFAATASSNLPYPFNKSFAFYLTVVCSLLLIVLSRRLRPERERPCTE